MNKIIQLSKPRYRIPSICMFQTHAMLMFLRKSPLNLVSIIFKLFNEHKTNKFLNISYSKFIYNIFIRNLKPRYNIHMYVSQHKLAANIYTYIHTEQKLSS